MLRHYIYIIIFVLFGNTFLYSNNLDTIKLAALVQQASDSLESNLAFAEVVLEEVNCQIMALDKNYKLKSNLLKSLGNIAYYKRDLKLSLYYDLEALEYAKSFQSDAFLGKSLHNIAVSYSGLGKMYEASRYLSEAITYKTRAKANSSLSISFNSMAGLYYKMNYLPEALHYYKLAQEAAITAQDTPRITRAQTNLSTVLLEMDSVLACRQLLEKTFPLIGSDEHDKLCTYYNNLSKTNRKTAIHLALDLAYTALEHGLQSTNQTWLATSYINIADMLLEMGRYEHAKLYLDQCHNYLKWEDASLNMLEKKLYFKALSDYYFQKEDFKNANYYMSKYLEADDIASSSITLQRVNHADNQLQQSLKDLLIKNQQHLLKQQRIEIQRATFRYWLLLISALLLLTSLVCVLLYIHFKRQRFYKKKWQQFNEALTKSLDEKKEFIDTFAHELRTPLYTITGLTPLLLQAKSDEELHELLQTLKYAITFLSNFAESLIFFNGTPQNSMYLSLQRINLRTTLFDVLHGVQLLQPKNNIHIQYHGNFPEHILGDKVKISLVFFNLFRTLYRYINFPVTITVSYHSQDTFDSHIHVEVFNSGLERSFSSTSITKLDGIHIPSTDLNAIIMSILIQLLGSEIQTNATSFYFELPIEVPQTVN